LAWEIIHNVLQFIVFGDTKREKEYYKEEPRKGQIVMFAEFKPRGMGYASYEVQHELFPKLIKAIRLTSTKEKVTELGGSILTALENEAKAYSVESTNFPMS